VILFSEPLLDQQINIAVFWLFKRKIKSLDGFAHSASTVHAARTGTPRDELFHQR
jgi:hypothetical protein